MDTAPQTFRDLQLEVLRYIDEATDTDTTLTLVKDALNRSHRRVLSSRTWPFMQWPGEETLTTTAGVRDYALKPGISKVLTLWDVEREQFYPLIPRRQWDAAGADRGEQRRPVGAIYGDSWPVKVQPRTPALLSIESTETSDTSVSVTVTGLGEDGEYVSETIEADGTNLVTSDAEFAFILSVTKTGEWVGRMTLIADAAGDDYDLLSLLPSQTSKQYPTLQFVETPDSSYTFTYTAQRLPSTLVLDSDVPDTPYPFAALHVWDALLDLTAYNTELGAKEQRLWTARRDELMKALEESVDESILGSHPRFVRDLDSYAGRRRLVSR